MRKWLSVILLFVGATLSGYAQDDDNQESLRQGEVKIENGLTDGETSDYPFLKISENVISLNGDDWSGLAASLYSADISNFSVLHIGDSHIQADVLSGTVRDNLQQRYGNGGRGLITPLKIAGTNEPYNYKFTIDQPVMSAKLLSVPWLSDMRFTGVSFTPRSMKYSINLSTNVARNPDGIPFNKVRLYSRGRFFIDRIRDGNGVPLIPTVLPGSRFVDILLPVSVTEINLDLHSFESVSFSGADLISGDSGVLYHAIGNNGASFTNYNRIERFGEDVATLRPDLIIISLGTNDAFGRVSDETFISEMDYFIRELRSHNPTAKLLLVTPMECQKTTRAVRRSRKGKRRTYSSSRTYSVNTRVAELARVIRQYGVTHKIPVYDFYNVAGGDGASAKWLDSKLLSTDRIHLSFPGYRVAGDLMTKALENTLSSYKSQSNHSQSR